MSFCLIHSCLAKVKLSKVFSFGNGELTKRNQQKGIDKRESTKRESTIFSEFSEKEVAFAGQFV